MWEVCRLLLELKARPPGHGMTEVRDPVEHSETPSGELLVPEVQTFGTTSVRILKGPCHERVQFRATMSTFGTTLFCPLSDTRLPRTYLANPLIPLYESPTIRSKVQAAFPRDRLPKRRLIMRRSGFPQKSAVDEFVDAVFAGFNNSDAMPSLTPDRVFGERPARL
jgi:hypothetical protein